MADTPGFFDTDVTEEELKPDIVTIVHDFAADDDPGLHVFLIALKVERFTTQDKESVNKLLQKKKLYRKGPQTCHHPLHTQLKGSSIEEFVNEIKSLRVLV